MVTKSKIAYFAIKAHRITGKHTAKLSMDNDVCSILSDLKIFVFPNIVPVNRRIVCAEFPVYMMKDLIGYCRDYDIEQPFSPAGREILQIQNSYIGRNRQDVLDKFPSLKGYVLDGEGNPTTQLKLPKIMWAFEVIKNDVIFEEAE